MAYTVKINEHLDWVVNVAAKRMILEELERPELLNIPQLEKLTGMTTCIVVCKDGVPAGTLCYFLTDNFLNPNMKVASEVIWYVLPEFHNTRTSFLLLTAFDSLAREEADSATLSILPKSNIKSLEKFGFINTEMCYTKCYKE